MGHSAVYLNILMKSTCVEEDFMLTVLVFRWGRKELEPRPPQSLSTHSLAWKPERCQFFGTSLFSDYSQILC